MTLIPAALEAETRGLQEEDQPGQLRETLSPSKLEKKARTGSYKQILSVLANLMSTRHTLESSERREPEIRKCLRKTGSQVSQ